MPALLENLVVSFNGNKTITSGGGGNIDSAKKVSNKARYLVSQAKSNPIEFVHNDIGFNYK